MGKLGRTIKSWRLRTGMLILAFICGIWALIATLFFLIMVIYDIYALASGNYIWSFAPDKDLGTKMVDNSISETLAEICQFKGGGDAKLDPEYIAAMNITGGTTAGNTTAGNTTAGNTTAGNTTAGSTTAGSTTAGNTTAGNTTTSTKRRKREANENITNDSMPLLSDMESRVVRVKRQRNAFYLRKPVDPNWNKKKRKKLSYQNFAQGWAFLRADGAGDDKNVSIQDKRTKECMQHIPDEVDRITAILWRENKKVFVNTETTFNFLMLGADIIMLGLNVLFLLTCYMLVGAIRKKDIRLALPFLIVAGGALIGDVYYWMVREAFTNVITTYTVVSLVFIFIAFIIFLALIILAMVFLGKYFFYCFLLAISPEASITKSKHAKPRSEMRKQVNN